MKPIRLFATDIDGTILGSREGTRRFVQYWNAIPLEKRPILVYNTGRLLDDLLSLIEKTGLPHPDYCITGVGTQIFDFTQKVNLLDYQKNLQIGWDVDAVERIMERLPGVVKQGPSFQSPYKSSWYWKDKRDADLQDLKQRFQAQGIVVQIVYSSSIDLDILPSRADKGQSLHWLCQKIGISTDSVLVAGDTGNDTAMFQIPEVRGIVVENFQPELLENVISMPVYITFSPMGEGVVQGLKHYGVTTPEEIEWETSEYLDEPHLQALFGTDRIKELTEEEVQLVLTGYDKALVALRKCISPLGFLAASLEDNVVVGTDENYRSVWARDGSITLIHTIFIDENDIRSAARATLETLILNISPLGQVPSNVRIDTGIPDYSGVGGVASIDSGLWLILAFYHYVRVTSDLKFLKAHIESLLKVIQWISAHDSNNNGLIEVPEAGDWTDLFGRSYNVLYDEVLWFRAHVCFGRLLAFLGKNDLASSFLRKGQTIKSLILRNFWPSTRQDLSLPPQSFADRQTSLGDVQYLLAQISPFSFDWRCDILGNILAYQMNLLDHERAMTAFRFMWGTGVNHPFPVVNLYPPVQSGDPDWKNYYLVNLLNLPHHYHNGGIWPFIGGMWVRFVNRLGLRNVAAKELVKLAHLNRQGTKIEWEFNEWAHAVTGRPMGKCFQAWSAACYLIACYELQVVPKGA